MFSFLTARPVITMVTRLLCGCKWVAWMSCGGDVIMVKDAQDARVEKNTCETCVACRRANNDSISRVIPLQDLFFSAGLVKPVVQILTCQCHANIFICPITKKDTFNFL